MDQEKLKFKHKNTLRHLIFLLLGILFMIIGFVAYYTTKDFFYFYLIAIANIAIIYVLINSQIKKNQVVYDAIFLKYRLINSPVQRIKIDDIYTYEQIEKSLRVELKDHSITEINLANYQENSVQEFKNLLQKLCDYNAS
ncbi:hypothetical protein [Mesonia aquimarina]|uniref:hypothetical protein n=1 Tax=Mesonia aquimarina TaxID=1504967 RepID=UPI000EF5A012|nr:hypothetical protein [Mesonia aquimarina]